MWPVEALRLFKSLNRTQRNTFLACFLGWALDALDFFLLTFVLVPVASDFGRSIPEVAFAITLTLMMRPLGAFIFGLLGDKFGRRVPLMIDIVFYSVMELLTAFAPNFTCFLIFRALFGIGMGGEWGLGASLAMESLPTETRGLFSGETARLWGKRKIDDCDCLRHRRDLWRHGRRVSFTTLGPAALDRNLRRLRNAAHSALDFRAGNSASHHWRISHAIHGARSVGRRAGAFKRAIAARVRGTFPGLAYQFGNFAAAYAAQQQAWLAERFRRANGEPNYALTMAVIQCVAFLAVIIFAAVGREKRGIEF